METWFCAVVAGFLLIGCASEVDGTQAHESGTWIAGPWKLTKSCAIEDHESSVRACMIEAAGNCGRCYDLCSRNGDCDVCDGVCNRDCAMEATVECEFVFVHEAPLNEELFRACESYREHNASCGVDWPSEDGCERFARAEAPDAQQSYGCLASVACGGDASACAAPGTEDLLAIGCPSSGDCYNERERRLYEMASGWASVEAIAALRLCAAQEQYFEQHDCRLAWLDAFYGGVFARWFLIWG